MDGLRDRVKWMWMPSISGPWLWLPARGVYHTFTPHRSWPQPAPRRLQVQHPAGTFAHCSSIMPTRRTLYIRAARAAATSTVHTPHTHTEHSTA